MKNIVYSIIMFFALLFAASCSANDANNTGNSDDSSIGGISGNFEWKNNSDGDGIIITGYRGNGGSVNIPAEINGNPVTIIGRNAFREKNITSVTIPESVYKIDNAAFFDNQLTSVTIPKSVIGEHAFGNNKLTNVTIGSGVRELKYYSFGNNPLTSVTIPRGYISDDAFGENQLTAVNLGEGVTYIGSKAFYYNNNQLTSIIIPNTVKTIGSDAFGGNLYNIKSITIGANVKLETELPLNNDPFGYSTYFNGEDSFKYAYDDIYNKTAGTYILNNYGYGYVWEKEK